jgi:hypothetical protein
MCSRFAATTHLASGPCSDVRTVRRRSSGIQELRRASRGADFPQISPAEPSNAGASC